MKSGTNGNNDVQILVAEDSPTQAAKLQGLLGELNVLTASLRSLIEETERNPRGFIFGRAPVPDGPGEGPGK